MRVMFVAITFLQPGGGPIQLAVEDVKEAVGEEEEEDTNTIVVIFLK